MTAIAVVVVIASLSIGATLLWRRIAKQLSPLVGRNVRVEAWGQELAGTAVTRIVTIGAGVHVFISGHDIKIAQPRDVTATGDRIEIAWAKYVQWDRTRVARTSSGGPAVVFHTYPE